MTPELPNLKVIELLALSLLNRTLPKPEVTIIIGGHEIPFRLNVEVRPMPSCETLAHTETAADPGLFLVSIEKRRGSKWIDLVRPSDE